MQQQNMQAQAQANQQVCTSSGSNGDAKRTSKSSDQAQLEQIKAQLDAKKWIKKLSIKKN